MGHDMIGTKCVHIVWQCGAGANKSVEQLVWTGIEFEIKFQEASVWPEQLFLLNSSILYEAIQEIMAERHYVVGWGEMAKHPIGWVINHYSSGPKGHGSWKVCYLGFLRIHSTMQIIVDINHHSDGFYTAVHIADSFLLVTYVKFNQTETVWSMLSGDQCCLSLPLDVSWLNGCCSFLSQFRLRNDLYCVGWGVKLYSLTHFVTFVWSI